MMIKPIPKSIQVTVDREELQLPYTLQESINTYWDSLTKEKPYLTRGEIYSISHTIQFEEEMKITLQKTDYAHFLYSKQLSINHKYKCRGVVANGVILTKDGFFVIGEMNTHTSTPGRLQFVAGGIEKSDIQGNVVNMFENLSRETQEELGIDLTNSNVVSRVTSKYIVHWQSIALVYLIELSIDSYELKLHYDSFESRLHSKSIIPEFSSIVFVHARRISEFIKNDQRSKLDFLPKVLEQLSEELIQ
ncbi:NUDIX hydrolase [Paenibacillus whitsoniae]|uniref:NUDIX hydrolase n=1 Tax=Paenibacillus whitsoniae TaxID=2496558 RepID=A0A430JEZ2_9BACL|nr:NUDIX hydrolase [Paenibacillus whitsoniae]RTE09601.1 NUDIX hydrolase [Paenibacillus whitsoniae]